jgi:hypothetical protein
MAHFDRERIPERVVHAKGAGAFKTVWPEAYSEHHPKPPKGQTLTPEAKLYPRGDFFPWGWNSLFAPPFFWTAKSVHPWGWTKGWTFPLGRGQISPLGARVKVKNSPQIGRHFCIIAEFSTYEGSYYIRDWCLDF